MWEGARAGGFFLLWAVGTAVADVVPTHATLPEPLCDGAERAEVPGEAARRGIPTVATPGNIIDVAE